MPVFVIFGATVGAAVGVAVTVDAAVTITLRRQRATTSFIIKKVTACVEANLAESFAAVLTVSAASARASRPQEMADFGLCLVLAVKRGAGGRAHWAPRRPPLSNDLGAGGDGSGVILSARIVEASFWPNLLDR